METSFGVPIVVGDIWRWPDYDGAGNHLDLKVVGKSRRGGPNFVQFEVVSEVVGLTAGSLISLYLMRDWIRNPERQENAAGLKRVVEIGSRWHDNVDGEIYTVTLTYDNNVVEAESDGFGVTIDLEDRSRYTRVATVRQQDEE